MMACERCGCEGMHACIGLKLVDPWTDEDKERFRLAMEKVSSDLRRLEKDRRVTPEMINAPMDAPLRKQKTEL